MSKALVVYYSRKGENYMPDGIKVLDKGHTEVAAEYIQKALGADLFQIETRVPYSDNYRECVGQSVAEAKANARPELKGFVEDISGYDTVFVCYPCWCGTAPMCVFSFLEHYDFTGKKIVPLCTNEGSGMANSEDHIRKACPGADVVPGLSVRGHKCKESEAEIAAWAKENA